MPGLNRRAAVRGDTLHSMCQEQYGDFDLDTRVAVAAAANRIADPDHLFSNRWSTSRPDRADRSVSTAAPPRADGGVCASRRSGGRGAQRWGRRIGLGGERFASGVRRRRGARVPRRRPFASRAHVVVRVARAPPPLRAPTGSGIDRLVIGIRIAPGTVVAGDRRARRSWSLAPDRDGRRHHPDARRCHVRRSHSVTPRAGTIGLTPMAVGRNLG